MSDACSAGCANNRHGPWLLSSLNGDLQVGVTEVAANFLVFLSGCSMIDTCAGANEHYLRLKPLEISFSHWAFNVDFVL